MTSAMRALRFVQSRLSSQTTRFALRSTTSRMSGLAHVAPAVASQRYYSAAGTKIVKPTAEMYPEIIRDPRFGEVCSFVQWVFFYSLVL